MFASDIIRAWKDPEYRDGLDQEQLMAVPGNPAGTSNLSSIQVGAMFGGDAGTQHLLTLGCCGGFTSDPGACTLLCGTQVSDGCVVTFDYSCK
jgi:mersacidin/lichenicidin family type 2 lantibiotic